MKLFILVLVLTLSLTSNLLADDMIYDLDKVEVSEVKYLHEGKFYVTLSMPSCSDNSLFFNNETFLSFKFYPDTLDGISVVVTPDQEIARRDIALSGRAFINLLLSKMASGDVLDLSCGFSEIRTDPGPESTEFVLTYFQVNQIAE